MNKRQLFKTFLNQVSEELIITKKLVVSDERDIRPEFFPIVLNSPKIFKVDPTLEGRWDIFYESVLGDEGELKTKEWANINGIYPGYENKGFIAINHFNSKKDIIKKKQRDWELNTKLLFEILTSDIDESSFIKHHHISLIKYIVGELVANSLRHAFKDDEGESSVGIYIDKKTKELYLTVWDHGTPIPDGVVAHGFRKKPGHAIDWAFKINNTTKVDDELGGRGLFRVSELIEKSNGTYSCRSGNYYYDETKITNKNYYKWPGTVFYIIINLEEVPEDILKVEKKFQQENEGIYNEW